MTTRSFTLLVLLVTLTGCVVTYGGFPRARVDSLPKDHAPIPFSYHLELEPGLPPHSGNVIWLAGQRMIPNWYPLFLYVGEAEFLEVRHTLETSGMFSTLSEALGPPEQGSHCDITFILRGASEAAGSIAVVQGVIGGPPLMIFLIWDWIPYYSGEGELEADYRLSKDGVPQKTYQYTIKKKGAGGILLLPFAWLNFFTDDLKDALRATTLQFLIDAQRDGNL